MKPKQKIGYFLLNRNYITEDILQEALDHQKHTGRRITEYLLEKEYITELNLAECIAVQFDVPYISLATYEVSKEAVDSIPLDIVKRYSIMPLDKIGDLLTIVILNPLEREDIDAIESACGCKVQSFVGVASDISKAIEKYYKVNVTDEKIKNASPAPLNMTSPKDKVSERRRSVRIDTKLDIHFSKQDRYRNATSANISFHGILINHKNALPIGAIITLEANFLNSAKVQLSKTVGRVVWVGKTEEGFDIGVDFIKISHMMLKMLMKIQSQK